jgi:predicted nucleic-acid-binding Zn-ribbon protein
MKNGQCPKCNSSNVFKHVTGVSFGDHGGGSSLTIFSGDLNHLNCSDYESYVCVDCGCNENYILDKVIFQEVQQKWIKVA